MTTLDVRGRLFTVRFRHTRNLSPTLNVQAITTCVIIAMGEGREDTWPDIEYTAIGNAICWSADTFSRRFGRRKAFGDALDHCGPLKPYALDLFEAYLTADPDPPRRVREKLSDAVKKARWEAGWEKRMERSERRGAAIVRAAITPTINLRVQS